MLTFLQRYSFRLLILGIFIATWCWAAWKPLHPDDWLLENYLVFFWVPILLLSARFFQLSDVSYGLITLFMCLHVIGSHYTYSEVPFGYTVQEWLGADRNMYDRVVHFAYGLLLAYPVREVLVRIAGLKGFWAYFFPVDVVLSMSALYEIIEWQAARFSAPELGLAFLGTQGDIWDAQKDMALAVAGALVTVLIVLVLNLWFNPRAVSDIRDSVTAPEGDHPLGETQIDAWIKQRDK